MKRFFWGVVLTGLALCASIAPARDIEPQLGAFSRVVIPTSANVGGQNNTFFQTRHSIFNVTDQAYSIQVLHYGNDGQTRVANIPIAAKQILNYQNFLQDVFGFTGAGAAVFDSGIAGKDFIVTAEVFNDKPGCGRFKTPVSGGPLLEPSLPAFDSFSVPVTVDANNRTNIGIFNDTSVDNTITIDLFDASGSTVPIRTITKTVGGKTWSQFGLDSSVSGGYIRYRVTGAAFLWAVTVSNDSGDGTFIPAADVVTP